MHFTTARDHVVHGGHELGDLLTVLQERKKGPLTAGAISFVETWADGKGKVFRTTSDKTDMGRKQCGRHLAQRLCPDAFRQDAGPEEIINRWEREDHGGGTWHQVVPVPSRLPVPGGFRFRNVPAPGRQVRKRSVY